MITVKMDEYDVLDLLIDRVKYWTDDHDTIKLYTAYYEEMLDCGCFDGVELNVPLIVDNDYVNYKAVIYKEDFDNYNITDEDDERIVARFDKAYLIDTY